MGAEGLDLTNDRELLLADDPDAFAAACVEALDDPALRSGLIDNAERRVHDDYSWVKIRSRFASEIRARLDTE